MKQKFCLARPRPFAATVLIGLAAFTTDASAAILLSDDFEYPDPTAY